MGYSKSRRSKGAPMHRNFGIGKPGAPRMEEFVDPYAGLDDEETKNNNNNPTNSIETNNKIEESDKQENQNNKANYGEFGEKINTTSGIDRWIDKPILEVLGLTKKQIAERKAKKNAKIEAARKAVGEGTETLKQAKLVTRSNKKNNKKSKKAIKKAKKDAKKLIKYRKKNPVTGKEAINKFTDGGNKSLI